MIFRPQEIKSTMESLQRPSGAFIASPTLDYSSVWIRDHLYMSLLYHQTGEYDRFLAGVRTVFDILEQPASWQKLNHITFNGNGGYLHAKYNADSLQEITDVWGHHQLDAIGMLLFCAGLLAASDIAVLRGRQDQRLIQLLVFYALDVRYWSDPDFGMWEECLIRRSSSVGAMVRGLELIKETGLAVVPEELIARGKAFLSQTLPAESTDRCRDPQHDHSTDVALLSLIWPYRLVDGATAQRIINNIAQRLTQKNGINRYWGDNYFRQQNGISAEWQWDFWMSICSAVLLDAERAEEWFARGCTRITSAGIAEAYVNDRQNVHTPLGWMHSLALIAWDMLPHSAKERYG